MHTAGRRSLKGFYTANAGRYQLLVLHIHLHRVATCPILLPLFYVLYFPGKKNQAQNEMISPHIWRYYKLWCSLLCNMFT
jgi:hypothetical protein